MSFQLNKYILQQKIASFSSSSELEDEMRRIDRSIDLMLDEFDEGVSLQINWRKSIKVRVLLGLFEINIVKTNNNYSSIHESIHRLK